MNKKVLLTILDGFGEAPEGSGNAITLAKTPNFDKLRKKYPCSILQAAGEAVGLSEGIMAHLLQEFSSQKVVALQPIVFLVAQKFKIMINLVVSFLLEMMELI